MYIPEFTLPSLLPEKGHQTLLSTSSLLPLLLIPRRRRRRWSNLLNLWHITLLILRKRLVNPFILRHCPINKRKRTFAVQRNPFSSRLVVLFMTLRFPRLRLGSSVWESVVGVWGGSAVS